MSRSRRKHAVVKDSSKWGKTHSHRVLRRAVNIAIIREDENMPLMRELVNPYDVCDWIWFVGKDDDYYEKALRK